MFKEKDPPKASFQLSMGSLKPTGAAFPCVFRDFGSATSGGSDPPARFRLWAEEEMPGMT